MADRIDPRLLDSNLSDLASAIGPHISPRDVSPYLDGELSEQEQTRIQDHVVACPACLELVLLRALPSSPPRAGWLSGPVAAMFGLVLLGAGVLFYGLGRWSATRSGSEAGGSAASAQIDVRGSGIRAGVDLVDLFADGAFQQRSPASDVPRVPLRRDLEVVVFLLHLSPANTTDSNRTFRVELLDDTGRVVWSRAALRTSDSDPEILAIVVPRDRVFTGRYQFGVTPATGRTTATPTLYPFLTGVPGDR